VFSNLAHGTHGTLVVRQEQKNMLLYFVFSMAYFSFLSAGFWHNMEALRALYALHVVDHMRKALPGIVVIPRWHYHANTTANST